MDRILEDFADETGRILETFGVSSALFVPPKVDLIWLPSPNAPQGQDAEPCLRYPVPADWRPELFYVAPPASWPEGWDLKRDTSNLLRDFLALAHEEMSQKVIGQVKAFAEQWGPLWICGNRAHRHRQYVVGGCLQGMDCTWNPVEKVRACQQEALAAQAVLEIARILRDNENCPVGERRDIPQHLLLRLRPGGLGDDLCVPRHCLANAINTHLSAYGGPTLLLSWPAQIMRPTLGLIGGFGFIHTVWVEIAQIVVHAHGILQCDGCSAIYVRERRAKKEQKNFCRMCGVPAAKRLSAQRRRQDEHDRRDQARQLHGAGVPLAEIAKQLNVDINKVHEWTRPPGKPGRPHKTQLGAHHAS